MAQAEGSENPHDSIPERFIPQKMHGELVEAEHLARYHWATAFCSGARVLDAGCGIGYGAELLHRAGAKEVTAVDISQAVVEVARQSVSPEVICAEADVRSLPYPDDSFDLVVCFEVLEHVEKQNQVITEFRRVLHPDGLMLISSPNRARYVPGNPHHKHEFLRDELQAALSEHFSAARIISQHVMLSSVIGCAGDSASSDVARATSLMAAEPGPEDEVYLLALAGQTLPRDLTPLIALTRFDTARRWLEYIDGQQRFIEEQAAALREMDQLRAERQAALSRLADREQALASFDGVKLELKRVQDALVVSGQRAVEGERRAAESTRRLQDVVESRTWRLGMALRAFARMARRR